MNKKKLTIIFITGFILGMFLILPIFRSLGIPTFDVLLQYLFGDRTYLGIIFGIILILLIILGISKISNKLLKR